MPPKKLEIFSKDEEFLLIDLVECRPILWDCISELYKRTDLKDAIWEEVARSLGSNFSGKYCMYYNIKGFLSLLLKKGKYNFF